MSFGIEDSPENPNLLVWYDEPTAGGGGVLVESTIFGTMSTDEVDLNKMVCWRLDLDFC